MTNGPKMYQKVKRNVNLPEKAWDLRVAKSEFSMVRDRSLLMPLKVNGASSDKSRQASLSLSTISRPLKASALK